MQTDRLLNAGRRVVRLIGTGGGSRASYSTVIIASAGWTLCGSRRVPGLQPWTRSRQGRKFRRAGDIQTPRDVGSEEDVADGQRMLVVSRE